MAPVRRYLRISKYSVLECRIYLDNPGLAQSWLLNPRNPILPRVIESVRPWVLPKLREERDRSKKKGTKKKGIKDVVVQNDFEVSIFLTETDTRHSLLAKHKSFHDKAPPRLQSNTNKLIGETDDNPVDVDREEPISILNEDSDDDVNLLATVPAAPRRSSRRSRPNRNVDSDDDDEFQSSDADETASAIELDSDTEVPPPRRVRDATGMLDQDVEDDDKKKMAMDVSYEGFAIYGRVLCLVVRKRDNQSNAFGSGTGASSSAKPAGPATMDTWITSTQLPPGEDVR